jgi:hypothetical protein
MGNSPSTEISNAFAANFAARVEQLGLPPQQVRADILRDLRETSAALGAAANALADADRIVETRYYQYSESRDSRLAAAGKRLEAAVAQLKASRAKYEGSAAPFPRLANKPALKMRAAAEMCDRALVPFHASGLFGGLRGSNTSILHDIRGATRQTGEAVDALSDIIIFVGGAVTASLSTTAAAADATAASRNCSAETHNSWAGTALARGGVSFAQDQCRKDVTAARARINDRVTQEIEGDRARDVRAAAVATATVTAAPVQRRRTAHTYESAAIVAAREAEAARLAQEASRVSTSKPFSEGDIYTVNEYGLDFTNLTAKELEAQLKRGSTTLGLSDAEIALRVSLFNRIKNYDAAAAHRHADATRAAINTLALDRLNFGDASIATSEARHAYAAARSAPRLIVQPSAFPGEGLTVGRTYVFRVTAPDSEEVRWAILNDDGTLPKPPHDLVDNYPPEAHLSSGVGRVFAFSPPARARAVVVMVKMRSPAPVNFEDSITLRALVAPPPSEFSTAPLYAFAVLAVLVVTLVFVGTTILSRKAIGQFIREFGKFDTVGL